MILKTFESFKNSVVQQKLEKAEEFLLDHKHWKDEYGEWHISEKLDNLKNWTHNGRFIVPIYEINAIDLEGCGLTTLEGCPKIVHNDFSVIGNDLTNLKGSPRVGGYFYASQNNLTSLEGAPDMVKGFYCHLNPKLSSFEGAPKITDSFFISIDNGTLISDVEKDFYNDIKGHWTNYYLDLLKYIIRNYEHNFEETIKTVKWPEGFLSNNLKTSVKVMSKFNLGESLKESVQDDILENIWNNLNHIIYLNPDIRDTIKLNAFNEKRYDVWTFKDLYMIENIDQIKIRDRYNKIITSKEVIEYIDKCLEKYLKFILLNPNIGLPKGVRNALSGSTKDERAVFDAFEIYKSLKWTDFSQEFIDTLSDDEKRFLDSKKIADKFNL